MFQKINLNFDDLELSKIKGELQQRWGPSKAKYTVYTFADWEYFYSLHHGKINFGIRPHYAYYAEVTGDSYLWPHIDPATTCKLNYYVQTGNCTTTFYKEKDNVNLLDGPEETDAEKNSQFIVKASNDFENLDEIGSFLALPGEAYLIRVDLLHSVSQPQGVRNMISWVWHTHTFEEILESIQIL